MDLTHLSDNLLLKNTQHLAQKERETTLEVLHHLREVERRSLFAVLAYQSLFEYAVKELKYSAGAAQRRIVSMRLLKELPEIEHKVEKGELSLSALSQAQVFFRQENSSIDAKREILSSLENKSTREVERELVSRCAEPERLIPEKLRAVSATHTELKILVEESFLSELDELRGLLAAKIPSASVKEILAYALKCTLKEIKPKAPKSKEKEKTAGCTVKTPLNLQPKPKSNRYVAVEVRRAVWQRDKGQCGFMNPMTKKLCASKHGLELDHIHPHALGGDPTVENLRLRCRAHNQLGAVQSFGRSKMSSFVNRMG